MVCVVELSKAKNHAERILVNVLSHVLSASFSSYQLVQMMAINLYALHHARRKLGSAGVSNEQIGDDNQTKRNGENNINGETDCGNGQQEYYDLIFHLTGKMAHDFASTLIEPPCNISEIV